MSYTIVLQEPILDMQKRGRIARLAAGQLGIPVTQLDTLLGREKNSVIARAGNAEMAQQVSQILSNLGVLVAVVEPVAQAASTNTNADVILADAKPRRGLGRRILVGALAPLAVAGLGLAIYLGITLPNLFDTQLRERALSAAISGGIAMTNAVNFAEEDPEDLREVNRIVRGLARSVPAAAFAGVTKGAILSFENRIDEDDPSYRQEIQDKLRTTSVDVRAAGTTSSSQTANINIKGVPYTFGIINTGAGNTGGRFFIALKQDRMQTDLLRTLVPTVLAVLIAIIATALLAMGLISRIVRPITTLTAKANAMSNGDLEQPILATSKDEIADLSDALERMRASLKLMMTRARR